jgi:hypothetical protein
VSLHSQHVEAEQSDHIRINQALYKEMVSLGRACLLGDPLRCLAGCRCLTAESASAKRRVGLHVDITRGIWKLRHHEFSHHVFRHSLSSLVGVIERGREKVNTS